MIFLQNHLHTRTIFLRPSTIVRCGNCPTEMVVVNTELIPCEGGDLPAMSDFTEAIEAAMEAEGWEKGYCSCCLETVPGLLNRDHEEDEL